jgi:PHD/YefM family antitoxin component YafN of YafNO toxin-antitoxin module
MIQARLNLDAAIDNLDADKQQVLITTNKSFVNTMMEESLLEIVREAS